MRLSWSHDPSHRFKSYFSVIFVSRAPRSVDGDFCSLILGSRYLVFGSGLLGNPSVLVFVRDSRVRDWLWLGKVLAPLEHPT